MPSSVTTPSALTVTVTPSPEMSVAVKVPSSASSVIVVKPFSSTSLKSIAERSIAVRMSSSTSTTIGAIEITGASFVPVIVTVTSCSVPSVAVNVIVSVTTSPASRSCTADWSSV